MSLYSESNRSVDSSTVSSHMKRLLHVVESLQPSRGLGFLCGVVHAQVYSLCNNGSSSKLHVADHSKQMTWTVHVDGDGTRSAPDEQGRVWTSLDAGHVGVTVRTNRVVRHGNRAVLLPVVFDAGGDDTVLGVLEVNSVPMQRDSYGKFLPPFSTDEILLLRSVCVHIAFCFNYCSKLAENTLHLSQIGEKQEMAKVRQKEVQLELEYERRLVRCISSLAAWSCKSTRDPEVQSAERMEAGSPAGGHRGGDRAMDHDFSDLFSLVPTAAQVISGTAEFAVWYVLNANDTPLESVSFNGSGGRRSSHVDGNPGPGMPYLWTLDRARPEEKSILPLTGSIKRIVESGEPTQMDNKTFVSLLNGTTGGGAEDGAGEPTEAELSDGRLDVNMLTPAPTRHESVDDGRTPFLLVPAQSPGGKVVGMLVLSGTGEDAISLSKLMSLLRDFAAHVALATLGVYQRHAGRVGIFGLRRRLNSTRRRAGILHSIEKLWNSATSTEDVFRIFDNECKTLLRSTNVISGQLYIVQRGGRKLWSVRRPKAPSPSDGVVESPGALTKAQLVSQNELPGKIVCKVGHGLVGNTAATGEPQRVGRHVCVVARSDSGQVVAVGIIECATVQEMDAVATDGTKNDTHRAPKHVMTVEEEALVSVWLKHTANAVSHFETLRTCCDGMAEASEALATLQEQLQESRSHSKERMLAIHRYHTAATAGADVCASLFHDNVYDETINNIGALNKTNTDGLELIRKIESNAITLMAATTAIVLLRGPGSLGSLKKMVTVVDASVLNASNAGADGWGTTRDGLADSGIGFGSTTLYEEKGDDQVEFDEIANASSAPIEDAAVDARGLALQPVVLDENDAPFVFQVLKQGKMLRRKAGRGMKDLGLSKRMGLVFQSRGLRNHQNLSNIDVEKFTQKTPMQILGVPMLTPNNGPAFGVLLVIRAGNRSSTPFQKTDMDMMDLFARLSLNGLFYQRTLENLNKKASAMALRANRRIQTQHQASQRSKRHQDILRMIVGLSNCRTIHSALHYVCERLIRILQADAIHIFLYDAMKQQLVNLDNDMRINVDPDATTTISRSVFYPYILRICNPTQPQAVAGADDRGDAAANFFGASPALKETLGNNYNNILDSLVSFRVGVDLQTEKKGAFHGQDRDRSKVKGTQNDLDPRSKLIDNVLGAIEIANMKLEFDDNLVDDLVDIGTAVACSIDRLRRQAQVLKYRSESNTQVRQHVKKINDLKKEVGDLTSELQDQKQQTKAYQELLAENASLHARAEAAEKGLDDLTDAMGTMEQEMVTVMEREHSLKVQVKKMEATFSQGESALQEALENAGATEARAVEAEQALQDAETKFQGELAVALDRLQKAEKRIGQIRGKSELRRNELATKLAAALKRASLSEERLKTISLTANAAEKDVRKSLVAALQRADESERRAAETEALLRLTTSKFEGKFQAMAQRMKSSGDRARQIQPAFKKALSEKEVLEKKLVDAEAITQTLSEKNAALEREVELRLQRVRELELTMTEFHIDTNHPSGATLAAMVGHTTKGRSEHYNTLFEDGRSANPPIPSWKTHTPSLTTGVASMSATFGQGQKWVSSTLHPALSCNVDSNEAYNGQKSIYDRIEQTRQELSVYRAKIDGGES